jgi:hypothetical protein
MLPSANIQKRSRGGPVLASEVGAVSDADTTTGACGSAPLLSELELVAGVLTLVLVAGSLVVLVVDAWVVLVVDGVGGDSAAVMIKGAENILGWVKSSWFSPT